MWRTTEARRAELSPAVRACLEQLEELQRRDPFFVEAIQFLNEEYHLEQQEDD